MALIYNVPVIKNLSKEVAIITSFTVDVENTKAYLVFNEGYQEGDTIIPVETRNQINVEGQDFTDLVMRVDEILAGQETPNVYNALKQAFYKVLSRRLGKEGNLT